MRKCFTITLFCLFLLSNNLISQIVLEGTISTPGMDPEPVQNALVELIDQADTTRVLSSTTDDKGHYSIQITQTGIGDAPAQKPGAFNLYQNYPNPFNPSTHINYNISKRGFVKLAIFNPTGQLIDVLISESQQPGHYQIEWNASSYPSGVYFYKIQAGEHV